MESRGGNLETVAEAEIGAPVQRLITEGEEVYAATNSEVVILDAESLETRRTVNFDQSLDQQALRDAGISGLAVTDESVYVSLEGEPYLVGFLK